MTTDERQQLAVGASTVFERVALARADHAEGGTFPPSAQADAYLRAWVQLFSPGDPAAFERRLTWDGLDSATVTRGFSPLRAPQPEPAWLKYIDQIVALAPRVAEELRRGPLLEGDLFAADEPPPFLELFVPALRVSRHELQAAVPVDPTLLPQAVMALERQLLRDLAGLAAVAVLDDFKRARTAGGEGYVAFTERMVSGALSGFFLSYPVLAKQVALTIGRWVATTAELVRRLEADREAITGEYGNGARQGRVVSLEPALSDPHNGGRRVVALQFESGLRLIYKPRHVGLERAFGDLVAWAVSRGIEPAQRRLRVLDRHEYGWIEYVDQEPFSSVDEVSRYYRKSGGLLCLAHVLRAEDLHMENVVATREGPVLIDLELMLQPVPATTSSKRPDGGDHAENGSGARDNCLTSSLLTFIQEGAGQLFDMGGLNGTGQGRTSLARRAWRALGSDEIDCVDEWTFETRVRNQVVLDGQPQRPDGYAEEVCRGFEETYRFLMAHRSALCAPDGPLARFSGCVSRVLLRSTDRYGHLRHVLVRPRYLNDGRRWSAALDALNRTFNQSPTRPAVWPLVVAERQALEGLDIPHFAVMTDETMIRAAGKPVMEGHFKQCGLSAVIERFGRLSFADLQVQLDHLTRALREPVHARFQTEPALEQPDAEDETSTTFLVAHATWIARELLLYGEHGSWSHASPPWVGTSASAARRHCLYDGSVGPAIFLAALSIATGDAHWGAAAREALAPLARAVDDTTNDWAEEAIGAASGLGSIVYGLTVVGELLGDGACLDRALRVASGLTDARIDSDAALDLTSGAAGAMLGLLALYRVTGEPHLLARALRCGEHLCKNTLSREDGAAWGTGDDRLFTGFAHGGAGIAYALGHLFDETRDERFRLAAADGYRYVASRFLPGLANWPVVDASTTGPTPGVTAMTAWCHGAPGIAIAIALGSAAVIDSRLREQLDRALGTTARAVPHRADHVCCGNAGRVEALFTAGRQLGQGESIEAARQLARRIILRARTQGHFRLSSDAFVYRIWDAGFFGGLSGIGYTLLRLAVPSRLPSILAFEAPLRRTDEDRGGKDRGILNPRASSTDARGAAL